MNYHQTLMHFIFELAHRNRILLPKPIMFIATQLSITRFSIKFF
jgi:hypothetical protein